MRRRQQKQGCGRGLALMLLLAAACHRPGTAPMPLPTPREDQPPHLDRGWELSLDPRAAAERLGEAVRLRTLSTADPADLDPAPFLALHALLEARFPAVHAGLEHETVNELSRLYTWHGRDAEALPVLFASHMDVVPIEPARRDAWTHAPFSGAVADGFVWGRGTLDHKVGMMGLLEAAEALLAAGYRPERTLLFAFGHDEEVGGERGAAAIAERLRARGTRLAWTLDEGSLVTERLVPGVSAPVALIGIAEKGYLTLRLSASGPEGHASFPPAASAVGQLVRALGRLEARPMPAHLTPPVAAMFRALAPHAAGVYRFAFGNLWLTRPFLVRGMARTTRGNALLRTTMAVTRLDAGIKENVLPAHATATISYRLLQGDSVQEVIRHVRDALDDAGIAIETRRAREPSPVAALDAPGYAVIRASIADVLPDVVTAPALVLAATDTRHYAALADDSYRFTPLRFGPGDLRRAHGTDERVGIDTYAAVVRFYAAALTRAGAGDRRADPGI